MNEYRKFVVPAEMRVEDTPPAKVAKVAKVDGLMEPFEHGEGGLVFTAEMRVEDTPPAKVAKVAKVDAPDEPPDTVFHMRSAVLGCEFWIMGTDAQAQALRGDGLAAYSVREVGVLKAMKARNPEGFDVKLRTIHQVQMAVPTTLEEEPTPVVVRGTKAHTPQPKARDANLGPLLPPCRQCGELRHWHDHAGQRWVCWRCEPPVLKAPGTPVPASLAIESPAATAA